MSYITELMPEKEKVLIILLKEHIITLEQELRHLEVFHGNIKSANAIMKGLEINYNFNRKHMYLRKKTHAEIAIPQIDLGVNKWLDLIKLSNI